MDAMDTMDAIDATDSMDAMAATDRIDTMDATDAMDATDKTCSVDLQIAHVLTHVFASIRVMVQDGRAAQVTPFCFVELSRIAFQTVQPVRVSSHVHRHVIEYACIVGHASALLERSHKAGRYKPPACESSCVRLVYFADRVAISCCTVLLSCTPHNLPNPFTYECSNEESHEYQI